MRVTHTLLGALVAAAALAAGPALAGEEHGQGCKGSFSDCSSRADDSHGRHGDGWKHGGDWKHGDDWKHETVFSHQNTPPVPEPETYALMLAGLGVVGFVARRRKKQG